ncbi:hypothetical protein HYU14_06520 [Candidatus Woesearchaeota archaeon]|nr:hypothetical protein [Candidatus Woesearchaeota archaeon]
MSKDRRIKIGGVAASTALVLVLIVFLNPDLRKTGFAHQQNEVSWLKEQISSVEKVVKLQKTLLERSQSQINSFKREIGNIEKNLKTHSELIDSLNKDIEAAKKRLESAGTLSGPGKSKTISSESTLLKRFNKQLGIYEERTAKLDQMMSDIKGLLAGEEESYQSIEKKTILLQDEKKKLEKNLFEITLISCQDEDADKSQEHYAAKAWSTSQMSGKRVEELRDYCLNSKALKEAYCISETDGPAFTDIDCGKAGCRNGACVRLEKSDYACGEQDYCAAQDVHFDKNLCKFETVKGKDYCRILASGIEKKAGCASRCIRFVAENDNPFARAFQNIHAGKHLTWYLESTGLPLKESFIRDQIGIHFDLADEIYEKLNEVFGLDIREQMFIQITANPENRGVFWTPTNFGPGMGLHYSSFDDQNIHTLITHELINQFVGKVASGGWPDDWWVNHRSPFPNAVKPFVYKEMGRIEDFKRMRQGADSAGWKDYQQYLFFKELLDEQGIGVFKRMFRAMREDGVTDWSKIAKNPSILLSHYVAAYISIGAGRNLADEMNEKNLGQFGMHNPPNPEMDILPYKFSKEMIEEIIAARNLLWYASNRLNGNEDAGSRLYLKEGFEAIQNGDYKTGKKKALDVLKLIESSQETLQYTCPEDIKSGLCGPKEEIFPLDNKIVGKNVYIYGPGKVLETSDFKISLDAPEFLVMKKEYEIKVLIENLKGESREFKYTIWVCDPASVCADFYDVKDVANIEGAVEKTEGKNTFFQTTFNPNEEKHIKIILTPQKPTMVDTPVNFLLLSYFDDEPYNPYSIHFRSWIKPDELYLSDPDINKQIPPQLTECNGQFFPTFIDHPRYVEGGTEFSFGYLYSKCCNKIFYPSFDCCSDNDCQDEGGLTLSGYCVDGKCMPKAKSTNKAFGTKKLLVGYELNAEDSCEEIQLDSIDLQFKEDISKMEQYYDYMANTLLGKPSSYLNFEIAKAIKVPLGLNGFFGEGKSEQDILNYLSSHCNLNLDEFDLIILPTSVVQRGEAAGWALSIGGKVELYQKGNTPTLIHETGHLFGCYDRYTAMGGKLQWGKTLYGDYRSEGYDLISKGRIDELLLKTFQVCRGELGWTDLNRNNIVDIEE